jgi:hypothetical protein
LKARAGVSERTPEPILGATQKEAPP